MYSSFRRDVSINLGLYSDSLGEVPQKRQSLLRSWRRLSSLQRLVLLLVLVLCLLTAIFVLPKFFFAEDASPITPGLKEPLQDSLPAVPKLNQIEGIDEKQRNLDELKKQAQNDQDEKEEGIIPDIPQIDVPSKGQYDFFNGQVRNERQEQVVEAFRHAWKAYKKYAWGHDELHPLSKTSTEWFGTGLTLVDSLDTMIIMGLKEEYEEARDWVRDKLSFKKDKFVNLFEITIRVLGSLLSTYHLSGDEIMKEKATELGQRLLPAFNSRSKIPYSDVNLAQGHARAPRWGPDSSTAEVATLQLEFRDLSAVSGDKRFEEAVDQVSMHIHSLNKGDGLVPIFINANTGTFRPSGTITLGARGDSYYEYLLKQWIQSNKKLDHFKRDFEDSYRGIKSKLFRRSEPNKLLFIGELLGGRNFSPKMDHLVCFYAGTLALAHHYDLGEGDEYLDSAKELAETCWQMYNRMATRLSPEITYFNLAKGATEDLIIKPLDAHNLLRPETVESLFYLYRFTGDEKYRDQGWQIFLAFEKHTKVKGGGYSSISNVRDAGNPRFKDKMESFFLSETLKYFYLLFSDDPRLINLDEWVLNTEGHPFPILKES
ncbi:mannosyl-oligosaccharide 1,2-alpha-mannosidase [Elysia marginata]|uniref:alpha-1,2-Mannosidase n=1 Tax=Elysia marginata TaxID=1093978 RepID=A0AAV4GU22_9GAST|nr:mannosyl-oligosaccharide 1,2-alpha-mannosidase [Elysia marginata]